MKKQKGFTLIELLVVIAVIGLIASIISVALNDARARSRDLKRRTDLKQIYTALQLYFDDNGSYPTTSGAWWGACAYGNYDTKGPNGYVPNLAPKYIANLPIDPLGQPQDRCYIYRSNGVDFKILAHQVMEEKNCPPMPANDPMYDGRSGSQCTIGLYTPGASGW